MTSLAAFLFSFQLVTVSKILKNAYLLENFPFLLVKAKTASMIFNDSSFFFWNQLANRSRLIQEFSFQGTGLKTSK